MNNQSDLSISFLFRKPSGRFNSIEEVFKNVQEKLNDKIEIENIYLPQSNSGFINKLKNIFFVARLKCDVLHITGDVFYTALFYRRPLIITIHDMGEIHNGSALRRWLMKLFWFQIPSWRASSITVISEKSKQELLDNVKVNESKVRVINNPATNEITTSAYNRTKVFTILQIGTKKNKNLQNLLPALEDIDCHLELIGPLNDVQKSLLEKHRINFTQREALPYHEIVEAYKRADLVAFISTYEGFGVPVLESQLAGRPVITSNISPMNDVAGDGAYFVNPHSIEDINRGIKLLKDDVSLCNELIAKGADNVKRFDVTNIANQYLKVYKDLNDGK